MGPGPNGAPGSTRRWKPTARFFPQPSSFLGARIRALRLILPVAVLVAACGDNGPGPDTPASLIKLAGDGQFALPGAAVPESLVVQVLDSHDNGLSGVAVSWSVVAGGGSITPASPTSDSTGRVAAHWVLGTLGANAVEASVAGLTVTFNATATTTPPSHLAIVTQPDSVRAGVAFAPAPVIELRDAGGAPVTTAGVTVTATLESGSSFGSLGGNVSAVTASNGRATFTSLKLTGPVGSYTLRFSAPGYNGVTSAPVDLSTLSGRIPLTDMGSRLYLDQYSGGLYPGGNAMPAAHAAAGAARARNVRPLDGNGSPSASGAIVLMSIGISNASQEWCDVGSTTCNDWTFTGQAASDPTLNPKVVIVNGAQGGLTAMHWVNANDPNYDRVRDSVLAPRGLTEAQVQVVWVKTVNADPVLSLPDPQADAIHLVGQYGDILRSLQVRYPNLQQVFFSSRIYGGYAQSGQNPEPYAYETGFAVKWIIEAQIDQMANGGTVVDQRAGNLNYNTVAPWIAWGPYTWADGTNPRSDGLIWVPSDLESDGTHPSTSGETKVGGMLLGFFKTDPRTGCWFVAGSTCP